MMPYKISLYHLQLDLMVIMFPSDHDMWRFIIKHLYLILFEGSDMQFYS